MQTIELADDFQKAVMRTANNNLTKEQALSNAAMGIAGESGEYVDLLKKNLFHGHPLDLNKAKKELGDIMFYVAWSAQELGLKLSEVQTAVIEKLLIRYPNGFNKQDSIERKDTKES